MRSRNLNVSLPGTALLAMAAAIWMISGVSCAADATHPAKSPTQMKVAPKLNGAEEVPPVETTASAYSTIVVSADGTVTGGIETSNIDGTKAHIHQGPTGTNGPVLVTLEKISPSQWIVPAGTTLTSAQYKSFQAGELYVNVHSAAHPSGEIRLQMH
ncbi:MAG: CHRD domain-containing protein [Steroidobacterales bacterium]